MLVYLRVEIHMTFLTEVDLTSGGEHSCFFAREMNPTYFIQVAAISIGLAASEIHRLPIEIVHGQDHWENKKIAPIHPDV